jgi:hypothetical protein
MEIPPLTSFGWNDSKKLIAINSLPTLCAFTSAPRFEDVCKAKIAWMQFLARLHRDVRRAAEA